MLDKLTVLEYEKPVADAYAEATRLLVENIAKHIASGRALNTAAWEVEKLKELGLLNRENAAIIRKVLMSVPDDVKYALSESAAGAFRDIMDAVTYAEFTGEETRPPKEINREIIEAWLQTATDKFNLTNTTMLQSAQQAYITAVNGVAQLAVDTLSDAQGKAVYGAFNASTAGILAGGMTLDEAKKTVIGRMAAAGIYGFVDRAGRHWSPEAYASMVLRTTAHNVSVQATKAASQEFGVNVFQCSWHPNSRPTHYDYQGKFYSWDNSYGTFEDGLGVTHSYEPAANAGVDTAAGLFGINCGHEPIPMDEGVSVPFDPADIQPKEESDKGYAQAQEQRAHERAIRHAKMMANVYETAGDDKQAAEWRAKTREAQAALRRYLNETGRTRSRGREQVGGTAPTAESAQAARKEHGPVTLGAALENSLGTERAADFLSLVKKAPEALQGLYARYAEGLSTVREEPGNGWCNAPKREVVWAESPKKGNVFATISHEMGHWFDAQIPHEGITFDELTGLRDIVGASFHTRFVVSASDKFLEATRKDRDGLKDWLVKGSALNDELRGKIFAPNGGTLHGVQDALCGWWSTQATFDHTFTPWGHSEKYYNRFFNDCVLDRNYGVDHYKEVKQFLKERGETVKNQADVKRRMRDYETASEVWANVAAAVTVGGKELEAVQTYLPNALKAFLDIAGGAE